MRNIALKLDYVGTNYHGWQRQAKDVTVQSTIEDAFSALTREKISFTGCGRTDAGVHARGYIANTFTECTIPLEKLPLALNARLPDDIAVREAFEVDKDFHAVFSCTAKEYTYTIVNSRIRDPFYMNRCGFVPSVLDRNNMRACAVEFKGEHDFAAMRSVGSNVKTTVRTVYDCEVTDENEIIKIRIKANGFLYNMARAMSGTLVYAGLGKLEPGDITRILEAGDRCDAGPTMEAAGLCMTGVWY